MVCYFHNVCHSGGKTILWNVSLFYSFSCPLLMSEKGMVLWFWKSSFAATHKHQLLGGATDRNGMGCGKEDERE